MLKVIAIGEDIVEIMRPACHLMPVFATSIRLEGYLGGYYPGGNAAI